MPNDEHTRAPRPRRYRFGELELDLDAYALTRAGRPLQIRPKVFDVLRHLIEQRGRLVTKEELLARVWSDSQVSEVAVPWTISHARRALGQRSTDKTPIETVHGRGYRFVADVEVLDRRASEPAPIDSAHALIDVPESPFVGRDRPMARLEARLLEAKAGRGGLCALVGEAGIGKTRCMDELCARARAEGFEVWAGRSTEDTVAPVFWPWLQALRGAAQDRPSLRRAVEPLLAALGPLDAAPGTLDLQQPAGSFWIFEGVASLLRQAAREAPTLLLFDDLHWADAGTIQLLSFLAPELPQQALLVVITQRDGGSAGGSRELRRLSRYAESIELTPLTADEVGQYLGIVGRGGAIDAELSRALHRATAGNPLFLLQTVRALIARHGRDALGLLAPELVKPAKSARDVLRSDLDALDERARRVLDLASVLGERFEVSTLQALCGLDAEAALGALEAASRVGLLIAEGPNAMRFRHALLRAVLYDDLPPAACMGHHRRAAELLEGTASGRARAGEIAHHYYRSLALGGYERAAAAAEHAARSAARVQAFSDAVKYAQWALEAQGLDVTAQPRARAELLRLCAHYEQLAGYGQDAQRTIGLLVEIAQRQGFTDLLVEAARILRPTHLMGPYAAPQVCAMLEEALRTAPEGPNALRIGALSQLSWTPPHALDMQRSKELSAGALALARQLGDEAALVTALRARLYALSGPDDIEPLLQAADEMLRRDRAPRTWVTVEALTARYGALISRGDLGQAEVALAAFGHLAHERKWPEVIWAYDRMVAQRMLHAGDFAAAEAALGELRVQSRRLRLSYGEALIQMLHALLITERHGPRAIASSWDGSALWPGIDDGVATYLPHLARLSASVGQLGPAKLVLETLVGEDGFAMPEEIGYLSALANLGLLAIDFEDRPRAERVYEALGAYPHHNAMSSTMIYDGSVSHFLGALAAFLGKHEHAARHFDDALAMNERLGMRPALARTRYEYARYLLGSGRAGSRKSGRALQAGAIESAAELGMSWLVALARTLA